MEAIKIIFTIVVSGIVLAIAIYFVLFVYLVWYLMTTAELDKEYEEEI